MKKQFSLFLLLCVVISFFASFSKDEEIVNDYLDETVRIVDYHGERPLNDKKVCGRVLYFQHGKGGVYSYDENDKAFYAIDIFESYRIINENEAQIKLCNSSEVVKVRYEGTRLNYRDCYYDRAIKSKIIILISILYIRSYKKEDVYFACPILFELF